MRKVEEYKTRNDVVEEKKVSTEFVEEKIKETETESTQKEGKETLIFADTSEEKTKEKAVLAEEKPIKVPLSFMQLDRNIIRIVDKTVFLSVPVSTDLSVFQTEFLQCIFDVICFKRNTAYSKRFWRRRV